MPNLFDTLAVIYPASTICTTDAIIPTSRRDAEIIVPVKLKKG